MKLKLKNLLTFLDDPRPGDNRHASAITGVIGEDLNAAAFAHYIERDGKHDVVVDQSSPTPGTAIGKRLDRWIKVQNMETKESILYQCEIKNWAASAIGGRRLPVAASSEELQRTAAYYWDRQMKTSFQTPTHPNIVTKVLLPMKAPIQYAGLAVAPLIIYWMPMFSSLSGQPEPLFKIPVKDLGLPDTFLRVPFETLNVFSVSFYFRQLLNSGIETLELHLPNTERRMEVLSEIST